jgi:hypothetical protein
MKRIIIAIGATVVGVSLLILLACRLIHRNPLELAEDLLYLIRAKIIYRKYASR